jgi:hypothetical protein
MAMLTIHKQVFINVDQVLLVGGHRYLVPTDPIPSLHETQTFTQASFGSAR